MVQNVCHDEEIGAADRIVQDSLGFPGSEAGAGASDDVGVLVVSLKIRSSLKLLVGRFTKADQIVVHSPRQVETALQSGDFQRRNGKDIFIRNNIRHRILLSFVYVGSPVNPVFEICIKIS